MAEKVPGYITTMMADRAWRMMHYVWHEVRGGWLFYDQATRDAIALLGWTPPRPSRRPVPGGRPQIILDNHSGEDFLYMHRQMIRSVNERLNGDPAYPRVSGWGAIPAPTDQEYPVPPAWETGDPDLDAYLPTVKSDETYRTQFMPWQRDYADPVKLRSWSLGEFGSRVEHTVHNQMHMRWCARPNSGMRPTSNPAQPDRIDARWDAPGYDWLGDTYSSHVNSVFWKLHGWIDDRINDWATANQVAEIPWKGTWLGKMPGHAHEHAFVRSVFAKDSNAAKMLLEQDHGHGGHQLGELEKVAELILRSGVHCHFYDRVELP